MKKFNDLYSITLLSLVILIVFSCKEETDDTPPSIETVKGVGLSQDNDNLKIGSSAKIALKIVKGGSSLNTITLEANGTQMAVGSYKLNGINSTSNPKLLSGEDRDSLIYVYEFNSVDTPQQVSYVFVIADDNDNIFRDTVRLNYAGTSASEVASNILLYNFAGPRFGGLDLYNAKVVSGNAPEATIRDYGVVDPVADKTWVMRLTPLNNSEIRNPASNYSYSSLIYKENIQRAFELGSKEIGTINSKVLSKGDYIIVKNDNNYFAVLVTNINSTANDNNDYFELSIKR